MRFVFSLSFLLFSFLASAQSQWIEITSHSSSRVAPPFAIFQQHQGLKDLFDSQGKSQLCFPAVLATSIIKQYAFQSKPLRQLSPYGMTTDGKRVDANELIRYLARQCRTDRNEGTKITDAAQCVYMSYRESGYDAPSITIIKSEQLSPGAGINLLERKPELVDISKALQQGYEVIAFIHWAGLENGVWTRKGAHFINVFGYTGTSLLISNPWKVYPSSRGQAVYDALPVRKLDSRPGSVFHPMMGQLLVDGLAPQSQPLKGFISGLILFKP